MSCAVDRWPLAGRPLEFLKVEWVMPSRLPMLVIRAPHFSGEPAIASPIAAAASLADLTAAARIR